jgi:uncharacterized surface protein with fasciclin (FAS1) repeats
VSRHTFAVTNKITPHSNTAQNMMRSVLVAAAALGLASALPNIVQLAQSVPDLSTLVTAVEAGGLVQTLSGPGPFTVFAPTNEAFAALPAGVLNNLLKVRAIVGGGASVRVSRWCVGVPMSCVPVAVRALWACVLVRTYVTVSKRFVRACCACGVRERAGCCGLWACVSAAP